MLAAPDLSESRRPRWLDSPVPRVLDPAGWRWLALCVLADVADVLRPGLAQGLAERCPGTEGVLHGLAVQRLEEACRHPEQDSHRDLLRVMALLYSEGAQRAYLEAVAKVMEEGEG